MEISTTMLGDSAEVQLRGRFDAHEAPAFRSTAAPLVDQYATVRVDLSNIVFIDSTALAELVRLTKTAQSQGREFVLRDPSVPVRVILELTGLNLALRIEDLEPAAEPS